MWWCRDSAFQNGTTTILDQGKKVGPDHFFPANSGQVGSLVFALENHDLFVS
jgi:hypothetical protein